MTAAWLAARLEAVPAQYLPNLKDAA